MEAGELADTVEASELSVDDGTLQCDGNHYRVWSTLLEKHSHADWLVVLEDDAIPVEGFRSQLSAALAVAPQQTPVVSLYLGTGYPKAWQRAVESTVTKAVAADASWIISSHLLHAVGVCIRTDLVPDMLRFSSKLPIDYRIGRWATLAHHKIAYCMPSLVDHRDGASLVPNEHRIDRKARNRERKAWRFGTRETWTHNMIGL